LGIQIGPRNRRQVKYQQDKMKTDLTMKGDEMQNMNEILPYVSSLLKDSCIKPLMRYTLMFDSTRDTIYEIDKTLTKFCKTSKTSQKQQIIPFIFHYDTTFNVGAHHVSILTMRDPTKRRLTKATKATFSEAILPVGVLVHEGRLQEQHEAFFRTMDAQFLKGKVGDLSKNRPFILVSDHEFGNIWPSAKTVFCSNHMKSNIKQMLKEKKLNKDEERRPVFGFYHRLLNARNEKHFSEIVSQLTDGIWDSGAMKDQSVQKYFLKNIVPKIRDHSGR